MTAAVWRAADRPADLPSDVPLSRAREWSLAMKGSSPFQPAVNHPSGFQGGHPLKRPRKRQMSGPALLGKTFSGPVSVAGRVGAAVAPGLISGRSLVLPSQSRDDRWRCGWGPVTPAATTRRMRRWDSGSRWDKGGGLFPLPPRVWVKGQGEQRLWSRVYVDQMAWDAAVMGGGCDSQAVTLA